MANRLAAVLLLLALIFPAASAYAIDIYIGGEMISVPEDHNDSIEIELTDLNVEWLMAQVEPSKQQQLLQDLLSTMYFVNILQFREQEHAPEITPESLENAVGFFWGDDDGFSQISDTSYQLALSDESTLSFFAENNRIGRVVLQLKNILNAYNNPVCVVFNVAQAQSGEVPSHPR